MNNLTIKIAIIDDNEQKAEDIIDSLSSLTEEKGFLLKYECYGSLEDYSQNRSSSDAFDLFLIDYDLGRAQHNDQGDAAVKRIKEDFPLVDILFYSAEKDRIASFKGKDEFNGVFFAELSFDGENEALSVAETLLRRVIQWYETPYSTSGIIVDAVSNMDRDIEHSLIEYAQRSDTEHDSSRYLSKRLLSNIENRSKRLFDAIGAPFVPPFDISSVLLSARFDRGFGKLLSDYILVEFNAKIEMLLHVLGDNNYDKELRKDMETNVRTIQNNRNNLAHSSLDFKDGKWICITKTGEKISFDSTEFSTVRKNVLTLKKQISDSLSFLLEKVAKKAS